MGGSGSGYRFDSGELERRRGEVEEATKQARLDAEVNSVLSEQLIEINQRDVDGVNRRLDEIDSALKDDLSDFERLLFGGSVAKQTYVEGLSDVDSLVVLDGDTVHGDSPSDLIGALADLIDAKVSKGDVRDIRPGRLAVTIEYDDGAEIQLLPAVRRGDALAIAAARGTEWIEIDPKAFAARLAEVNRKQAGAVVPTIKLAKAIVNNLPEDQRLSGYHAEALAVAAFDDYSGPRNPKAMITKFFESAAANVKRPTPDVTGQSKHVDEKLGPANSPERQRLARGLRGINRRMASSRSADTWRQMLGDPE